MKLVEKRVGLTKKHDHQDTRLRESINIESDVEGKASATVVGGISG